MRAAAIAVLLSICGVAVADDEKKKEDAVSETTDVGPVKATVSLTPAKPRIGDILTLTLRVEADANTKVELPPFGEALGRFTVVKFTPKREQGPDGKEVHVQVYQLQAPASGRQRIPQLRLEYSVPSKDDEVRELLTEELPVLVESVVPSKELGEDLSPPPGELDETPGVPWWTWPLAGALLALGAAAAVFAKRSQKQREALALRLGAYDRAMKRLAELERRGLPADDEADAWYVELSGIVRHYLEDRLQIRAPELTTEEFLQHAHSHTLLQEAARDLLSQFLALCDRVKFAGYRPGQDESEAAFALAKSVLGDQEDALRQREAAAEKEAA